MLFLSVFTLNYLGWISKWNFVALDSCFNGLFLVVYPTKLPPLQFYKYTSNIFFNFVLSLSNFSKLCSKVTLHPLIVTRLTRTSPFFTLRMPRRHHISTPIIDANSTGDGGKVKWNSLGCCEGCNTSYSCNKKLNMRQCLHLSAGL